MKKLLMLGAIPFLFGCQTAAEHRSAVTNQEGTNLSVGTVQREIKVGMSNADVVQVLGAPNMVTTDEQRREVWVYDKIATDRVYSSSSGGIGSLILGVGGSVLGGLSGSASSAAGASSTSQRTLTVIVKFDAQSKVRDFAYHMSKF